MKVRAMQTVANRWTRAFARGLAVCLLAMACLVASDCQAQMQRGLFRGRVFQPIPLMQQQTPFVQQGTLETQGAHPGPVYDQATHMVFQRQHHPGVTSGNEWRNSNFYDLSDPYPKYYGAFHSSHYSRLGVPHGDIGFRGNNIFWSPW